ncbi:methyltransferase family protein [Micromonospora sp. SL1-18]|uniref:methyltransferase family protein n=1 Tax=Micromonospora sp. SL1-18 TaxID=3399128 RepID=UPI003A4E28C7
MSTQDWLSNRRGEWYVVAQAVVMTAALFAPILDGRLGTGIALAAGAALSIAGLAIVVIGSIRLGRNLSPFPKPRDDGGLVREGIFSLVRHPIYSGFIFLTLGWSLVWTSLAGLIGALILLALFDIKARREERWLETKFAEYAEYRRRVKKLIPFVY